MLRSFFNAGIPVVIATIFSGCSSLGYLFQAGKGQLYLSNQARPISVIIADEKTSPRLKSLLSKIESIKKFGEKNGLRPTKNYTEYVKLDRNAAVWVVSASNPLKFESKEWHFPVVGSFPYLGWFNLEDAKKFAAELKQEGWDVDVRGARAYSTLGWFRDAILSSMIPEGDEALGELVNVVLHESVHATVYLSGQAYFNESVASFVADGLTPLYLDESLGTDSREKAAYLAMRKDEDRREVWMHEAYQKLFSLYSSQKTDSEKLLEKRKILGDLSKTLNIKREINNATLIQFRTYGVGRAEFSSLLSSCRENWSRFMNSVQAIQLSSFSKKQQEDLASVILPLSKSGCGIPN